MATGVRCYKAKLESLTDTRVIGLYDSQGQLMARIRYTDSLRTDTRVTRLYDSKENLIASVHCTDLGAGNTNGVTETVINEPGGLVLAIIRDGIITQGHREEVMKLLSGAEKEILELAPGLHEEMKNLFKGEGQIYSQLGTARDMGLPEER